MRTSSRHVLRTEHDLNGDERNLHPRPSANAREDLVADPFAGAGINLQRLKQTGADGKYRCTEPHEGCVPAKGGDEAADDDGGDGNANEVGDGADAGSFGGGAFDGLEVKGEVEDVSGGGIRSVSRLRVGVDGAKGQNWLTCTGPWRRNTRTKNLQKQYAASTGSSEEAWLCPQA